MSDAILATKLFTPKLKPKTVKRPQLLERLNEGLNSRLILVSAPAGYGKTTLISEWVSECEYKSAWLSLDRDDSDLSRFLSYFTGALQKINQNTGKGITVLLHSPQRLSVESIMTAAINDIAKIKNDFVLILDDYHILDSKPVNDAVVFLVNHLPLQMHLVIASREDPDLPLAKLRAKSQLTEIRASDLHFNSSETAEYFKETGIELTNDEIQMLETRTEGWISGLQLAAISIQGARDAAGFIKSFAGSHHFVLDYLIEEVLEQQEDYILDFLLRTSILERMCASLCDAILSESDIPSREILEYLEKSNLFIVPLDNERKWYRFHRLFADILHQRLEQNESVAGNKYNIDKLHIKASLWYEENGFELEAFKHAAAANDIDRAERLIEGKGMPLHFRGALAPVLNWLKTLPEHVLNARPLLQTAYASVLLATGQLIGVDQLLNSAEKTLQNSEQNDANRDLTGRVAAIRATIAVGMKQPEITITQSKRALEYLHSDNHSFRDFTIWKLGYAYHLLGDRAAAYKAYTDALAASRSSGNNITVLVSMMSLGSIQQEENNYRQAAGTYKNVLQLMGDMPFPTAYEVYLGLAGICYEWNELEKAEEYAKQGVKLAEQVENNDRLAACKVFLAKVRIAQGNLPEADSILAEAHWFAHLNNYTHQFPEIASAQILVRLQQNNPDAASDLAEKYDLTLSKARILLYRGDAGPALSLLRPLHEQKKRDGFNDELLSVMILESLALHALGEKENAIKMLSDILIIAEPGGFLRIFLDEGMPMYRVFSDAMRSGINADYVNKIANAFKGKRQNNNNALHLNDENQSLLEPLSKREIEILELIAQGLSNKEISDRLFLALITVKGHNRNIFGKLQVQRRTEAVARARDLGLL